MLNTGYKAQFCLELPVARAFKVGMCTLEKHTQTHLNSLQFLSQYSSAARSGSLVDFGLWNIQNQATGSF
jgi:hypothetical protein